ncbi:MAG: hypothetical protein HZA08_12280 [Nitrospirae bacterium]|nr:hypothetical protein [Nitrospirota bacterium]
MNGNSNPNSLPRRGRRYIENERDRNVPPIVKIYVDRRGFLTPPEGLSGKRKQICMILSMLAMSFTVRRFL